MVVMTGVLGAVAAAVTTVLDARAQALTGLDVRVSVGGPAGALIFVFFVAAPLREAAKVAATWPAFLSRHFDQPSDGLIYACASALGFAVVETASMLRQHPGEPIWIARALFALPAGVFFACLWGYALGRAKHARRSLPIFPTAFVVAVAAHGLFAHFVFGRGPGALLAVLPLLAAMGVVAWLIDRDLRSHGDRASLTSMVPSSRASHLPPPPSLATVREALRSADEPVRVSWIVFGAIVTVGAMITGVAAGVVAAHLLHVDLSTVDEHEVSAAAPALLLAVGLLASFPASGWLIARAASAHSLLEPALAAVLGLLIALVTLGFAAPFTVVFALALSPFAWVLSCFGAWIGRSA